MIPLRHRDLAHVVCPDCGAAQDHGRPADDSPLEDGTFACPGCSTPWPVADGLLQLYRDLDVQGTDRLMRHIYDALPRLHRPANRQLLPLMQFRTEGATRAGYIRRLELGALRPNPDGTPLRILEVGIGDGINLDLLADALPPGLDVELWGADFSRGMLTRCRRRHARLRRQGRALPLRLLMADAHALPFPDHTFDRVFHVGAAGSYQRPSVALAEMARVARPGTPIVVVDEQLEPGRRHGLYHRATFKMMTFYDSDPHCPVELLPDGAEDVLSEAISRFYYCLRFRMPG